MSLVLASACSAPRALDAHGVGELERTSSIGFAIQVVGDRDGDGLREFVLGDFTPATSWADGPGTVALYDGRTLKPAWSTSGAKRDDGLMLVRSSIGDIDGRGAPDFVVARFERVGLAPGRKIVPRTPTPFTVVSSETLAPLFEFTAWASEYRPVLGGADFDGDGALDLAVIVACPVFDGMCPGYVVHTELHSGRDGELIRGAHTESLGFDVTLALVDDFDADGVCDLAFDLNGLVEIRAGADDTQQLDRPRIPLEHGWDGIPALVPVTDVDGDGKREIVVGELREETLVVFTLRSVPQDQALWEYVWPEAHPAGTGPFSLDAVSTDDVDHDGTRDVVLVVSHVDCEPCQPAVMRALSGKTGAVLWTRGFRERGTEQVRPGARAWDDFDGDGVGDLLVGVSDAAIALGAVLVVSGATGETVAVVE